MNVTKLFFLLIFSFVTILGLNAQGGAQVFAGLVTVKNTHSQITQKDQIHSGYTIGIQSRLKDGSFVAGPGFKYTRMTMMSFDNADYISKEENYHLLSLPMNVGLEYRLTNLFKLRMYTGGDLHYFYKIDDNNYEINYDYVNDYFFGAHAGVGIDVSWIVFDVIVERGVSNAHKLDKSRYNFFTATLGFFF